MDRPPRADNVAYMRWYRQQNQTTFRAMQRRLKKAWRRRTGKH